ncbi:MAG TPA: FHA domain-containing protein, partial [Nannocystis exedens]|nr:FHA domain-containing protein [Nannocystis exedens]
MTGGVRTRTRGSWHLRPGVDPQRAPLQRKLTCNATKLRPTGERAPPSIGVPTMDTPRPPATPTPPHTQQLTKATKATKMPSPLAIRLHLRRDSGDQGPNPVEIFHFEVPEITIGRAASKGRPPTLALADRSVSRRHCAILVSARGLTIEDRGGQAGTFIDGRRLRRRRRLQPGQRFMFSGYTAWIERPGFRPKRDRPQGKHAASPSRKVPEMRPATEPWKPGKGAELWTLQGEPEGLLLRGRALRQGKIWLKNHPTIDTWNLHRRWIEASLAARTQRLRRLGGRGLALLVALLCALSLGVHTLPKPAPEHPMPSCLKDDLKAIQTWALDDRSSPMRAAIALAWAKNKGCPGGTIEGLLHQALATTKRLQVTDLKEAGTGITAIEGADAVLITTDTRALHFASDGQQTTIGAGGRWQISGNGRWAAEQLDSEHLTLWSLTGTPVSLGTIDINSLNSNSNSNSNSKPTIEYNNHADHNYNHENTTLLSEQNAIQAIVLDRRGHELWVAT